MSNTSGTTGRTAGGWSATWVVAAAFAIVTTGCGLHGAEGGSSGAGGGGGSGFSGFGGLGGFSGFGGFGGFNPDGGVDRRPWTPTFVNLGDDGTWRSSTGSEALCVGGNSLNSLSVWSDERGVYVLATGYLRAQSGAGAQALPALPPADPPAPSFDAGMRDGGAAGGFGGFGGSSDAGVFEPCNEMGAECLGRSVQFHDGEHGWQSILHKPDGRFARVMKLSGLPLGPLAIRDGERSPSLDACTLSMIEGGEERCELTGTGVPGFFAVSGELAYATARDNLLVYGPEGWSVHPTRIPFEPNALWANETDVVVAGEFGRIARFRDGVWTSINRSVHSFSSVWGGPGEELWLGTFSGDILHRDAEGNWGDTFRLTGVTCGRFTPIDGIWGSGDTVYFHTASSIARWRDDEFEVLSNWSCAFNSSQILRGMWGNGPNELFVAVSDHERFVDDFFDPCGDGFVLFYDGENFHRL